MTVSDREMIGVFIERLSAILLGELSPVEATQIIQAIGSLKYALSQRK